MRIPRLRFLPFPGSWRAQAGPALLLLLLALSLAYPLLERWGLRCPFGMDPTFRDLSVCRLTFQSLWRSALVGVAGGGLGVALGLALARLARRWRGPAEQLVLKAADAAYALPNVLVVILIGFIFKRLRVGGLLPFLERPGPLAELWPMAVLTASLTLTGWAAPLRMIHARLLSLEGEDFVQAAQALGAERPWILSRHLMPFLRPYVAGLVLVRIPATILAESVVSFLGFGLPPDQPSLGSYLSQNSRYIVESGPGGAWIPLPAWILLLLLVLAFQLTGQALLERGEGLRA